MRMLRLFLPVCLLLISANTAFADGAPDPRIVLGGSGSCQSFSEDSLTETFTGVMTGCVVDFTNNISSDEVGVTLETLVVNVDTPFSTALSCALGAGAPLGGTPFASSPNSCTFIEAEGDQIIPGSTYSLSFLNTSTTGGFPPTITITLAQTVIPTPEPDAMLLLGVGLAVLLAGRKWL
jgi:hypothetical protein